MGIEPRYSSAAKCEFSDKIQRYSDVAAEIAIRYSDCAEVYNDGREIRLELGFGLLNKGNIFI